MPVKFLFCALFFTLATGIVWRRAQIDLFCFRWIRRLAARFSTHKQIEAKLQIESDWLQYLLLALRSGESLDTALSNRGKTLGETGRKSRSILAGNPEEDVISSLLSASLYSGVPCLPTLQFLRRVKLAETRDRRKLRALTLGARLQSIILAFIPWALLASFFVIDRGLALSLTSNPLCWFVWGVALVLCIVGFRWMRWIMEKNLHAADPLLRESEELLPVFLLDLVVFVGAGRDVGESRLLAAKKLPAHAALRLFMIDSSSACPYPLWASIRDLLQKSEERGSPMREEVFLFLQELQNQKECRWEELAQKLPTQLLAPLFTCFFFASLLMSFSLMIPFLESF